MKISMVLGALTGFLISILFGLAAESAWPAILCRACFAALALALVMRWWNRVLRHNLVQSLEQQYAAQEAQRMEAKSAKTPKS
jgi:hypothetical protein